MRTTNKCFKEQVQAHVLECVNEELTLNEVVNNFYSEKYSSPYEQKFNKYDVFKDWMMGLPFSLNVEYTNYGINQTMKSWFENCGEEYKEKDNESDLYLNLVTREFRTLCKKEGISF